MQGRAKTMNESIYYNVDDIHKAIGENKKISFKYYRWDVSKKLVERNHGIVFTVSPWALRQEAIDLTGDDSLSVSLKFKIQKSMGQEVDLFA